MKAYVLAFATAALLTPWPSVSDETGRTGTEVRSSSAGLTPRQAQSISVRERRGTVNGGPAARPDASAAQLADGASSSCDASEVTDRRPYLSACQANVLANMML